MAFVLNMTDGTDTVNFMATATLLADGGFDIGLAKEKIVWASSMTEARGQQFIKTAMENRECKIKFRLRGTIPEIIAIVTKINSILHQARTRYKYGYGSRSQLVYQWDGATSATYFEIFNGYLDLPPDVLSVKQIHNVDAASDVSIHTVTLKLVLSPYGYAMSPINGSPVALSLANSGSKTTSPLAFVNAHDDGYNWVTIEDTDVPGDGPAFLKLQFAFSSAADVPDRLYIGHRIRLGAFDQILEAESGNIHGTPAGYTNTASGSASNDSYVDVDTTLSGTDRDEFRWTVDPNDYRGIFRVLAHGYGGADYDADMLYAARAGDHRTRYRKGELYQAITDLGSIQIPSSSLDGLATLADVEIAVLGRVRTSDPAVDIDYQLDFVQLLPICGGYRVLVNAAPLNYAGDTFVDDGWNNQYYQTINYEKSTAQYHAKLRPIMLEPGADQWLYFALSSYGFTQLKDGTVQAWTVPTYKTLAL